MIFQNLLTLVFRKKKQRYKANEILETTILNKIIVFVNVCLSKFEFDKS